MVFEIASLVLKGAGALAGALANFMTKSFPISVTDDHGNKKYLALSFGTPIKIEKKKEIGLVVLGNVDDSIVKKIENDIEAGNAQGSFQLLSRNLERKIQKGKAQILENRYANYISFSEEVINYGTNKASQIYESKSLRGYIKQTSKAKGMKWDEDSYNSLVEAKEDKYDGIGYAIKFVDKGTNKIIPMELVKFWQHVRYYKGEKPEALATILYAAAISGDKSKIKATRKLIKEYIKEEEKKKK